MKGFILWWKIYRLKRKARRAYVACVELYDTLGCGRTLARHINPRVLVLEQRYKAALQELSMLDPECPEDEESA